MRSVSAVSINASAWLRRRSGLDSPAPKSCSCSWRARSRMSLIVEAGTPTTSRNFCSEVEDEAVRGAGRQSQRALGTVALQLGLAPLMLRLPAVDLGEAGKAQCNEGDDERAADPIALPRGRSSSARPDEFLVQIGRRIGIGRPPVEPALGGFEIGAA